MSHKSYYENTVLGMIRAVRPEINAVIHTHGHYASALSILGRILPNVRAYGTREAAVIGPAIPCVPYAAEGSPEQLSAIRKVVGSYPECRAFLLQNHGLLCLGTSQENALAAAALTEDVCKRDYYRLLADQVVLPYDFDPDNTEYAMTDLVDSELIRDTDMTAAVLTEAPFTQLISNYSEELAPYLDEVQVISPGMIHCVDGQSEDDVIRKALEGRHAVILRGIGGVCTGATHQDAVRAVGILERNCRAALLAMSVRHLFPVSSCPYTE